MSLPGGKLFLGETVEDCLKRKIETEIGLEVEVLGLVKILNILMPNKNVYHLVFLAEWKSGEINLTKIEAENAGWYTAQELLSFNKDDYAEYYNDELLKEVVRDKISPIPVSIIQAQDNRTDDISSWMKKGMPSSKF
jgi:ADP-ribose pyrophosphatase YjhB (NUDIX family)